MIWNIFPFVGCGELRFGMSIQEVGTILDHLHPVYRTFESMDNSISEQRSLDLPICIYSGNKLITVNFHSDVKDVYFEDLDIFLNEPSVVLKRLEKSGNGSKFGLGMIMFLKIGINTGGFYDKKSGKFYLIGSGEQDDRSIAVAQNGIFDRVLDGFTDFNIPDL